ncbi:MAG: PH domain-containing protein [Clostridia bacterium]|nr:PH domain-containing protein [Clostridia bacterium]
MKCRICGAKLKKDGDICTNCYKEFQEEEDLKKDTNEKLKLKRKYSINYEISKCTELIILAILSIILCVSAGGFLEALAVVLIFAAVIGLVLFVDKRLAMATKAVFYEKKAVYTFKFLFMDVTKVVKYSEIADVRYFQTRRQKKFGFGDLCVYAKGVIPGSGYLNGFQIKNIENVEEVLKQIGEIVGPIEEE